MCLIIERIFDDRIPRKCSRICDERICDDRIPPKFPQKHRKFAKNLKPENANIYQVILQTFQCGS